MEDILLVPEMKIIDYLSIEDILNLKLVNKRFYQCINENVSIKDLALTSDYDLLYSRRWFYTYDLINLQNLIKYVLHDNVYLNLNQPILSQLKQLFIYKTKISLETLNSLDGLVHLEIFKSEIKSITENNVLSLPMLEILNLNWSEYDNNLLIDSKKLQRLKLHRNAVELVHPESITYLEVEYYNCCKKFLPSCTNLEHFYCCDLDDLNEFNLIKNLPKLKSIHFDQPKETFVSLINEKKRLNKDLKIYFLNLEFDELPDRLYNSSLGQYIDEDLIPYYAEHYSKLADHCPFVNSVNYNDLERCFDQIPENFTKRFVNLTEFIAYKEVNNPDQLIRVLGECKTITRLELHSSLGQHFFDFHLYNLCPNIYELDIYGDDVLNYEFILKFKYVSLFYFYRTESIEIVKKRIESHESVNDEFNCNGPCRRVALFQKTKKKSPIGAEKNTFKKVRNFFKLLRDIRSH